MATRQSIEAVLSADTRPLKRDMKEAEAITAASSRRMEEMAAKSGANAAGGKGGKAAGGLLQAASAVDDVQYGLRGVLNNVLGIAGYLGPVGKSIAALGVIGGVIYTQWDKITGKAKEMEAYAKSLERLEGVRERMGAVRLRNAAEENALMAERIRQQLQSNEADAEANARVTSREQSAQEHAFEMARQQRELEGKETAAMIRKEADMRRDLREREVAGKMQDLDRYNKRMENDATRISGDLRAADAEYFRAREAAQQQEIEDGKVSIKLQEQLAAAQAKRQALTEVNAKAQERMVKTQQQMRDLEYERTTLIPQQYDRDRMDAMKRIKELEEEGAEKAAKIRKESAKRMLDTFEKMINRAADALKKLNDQANFREKNAEQRKIDEARAAGRERAARRMELDRDEKERSKQLQEQGNIDKKDADTQAKQERQQTEDRERGRRSSRRKPAGEKRGSLLDEPRTTNLDDGRQRMAPMFDPKRGKEATTGGNGSGPATPAAGVIDAVAGTVPGMPGSSAIVPVLNAILKKLNEVSNHANRKPVNNPRSAA